MNRNGGAVRQNGRRKVQALAAAVALATSVSIVSGVAPAGAKPPPVTGSAVCTLSGGTMTFAPGLRDKEHITGTQKGRGPSNGTFTGNLVACTDASLGPAPGGIDHGTLQAGTHVAGSYCNLSDGIKIRRARVDWFDAANALIGSTRINWLVGVNCFKFELTTIGLADGPITISSPAA